MIDWKEAPEWAEFYADGRFWFTDKESGNCFYISGNKKWTRHQSLSYSKGYEDYEPRPTAQEWPDDTRINNIGLNRTEDDMGHYDELRESEYANPPTFDHGKLEEFKQPEEQLPNKYDRKIIGKYGTGNCTVDVYRVLDAFKTDSPAIDHAIKKLLCAGMRGAKDKRQDYLEAIQSIEAALKLLEDKKP